MEVPSVGISVRGLSSDVYLEFVGFKVDFSFSLAILFPSSWPLTTRISIFLSLIGFSVLFIYFFHHVFNMDLKESSSVARLLYGKF